MLNRNGTIQIHGRFDGTGEPTWEATDWADYVAADVREFLGELEAAGRVKAPSVTPRATPTTLTYRVLASIAATAVKTVHPSRSSRATSTVVARTVHSTCSAFQRR